MSLPNNDICPRCGKPGLPALPEGSVANARRCELCSAIISVIDGRREVYCMDCDVRGREDDLPTHKEWCRSLQNATKTDNA